MSKVRYSQQLSIMDAQLSFDEADGDNYDDNQSDFDLVFNGLLSEILLIPFEQLISDSKCTCLSPGVFLTLSVTVHGIPWFATLTKKILNSTKRTKWLFKFANPGNGTCYNILRCKSRLLRPLRYQWHGSNSWYEYFGNDWSFFNDRIKGKGKRLFINPSENRIDLKFESNDRNDVFIISLEPGSPKREDQTPDYWFNF
ncbi:unnamed protein product [Didymodactylos carnosus]|uniref:Uncharacterized protein n=1 Tax=Didymodactylos carnosus TaxID=1234261 RepID=A0A8S2RUW9_9BILA|nr:unnamed protein product [Didymodactylos carnosus]CAF4185325.1 unnamed protein product [Didymodactylos carnosus]